MDPVLAFQDTAACISGDHLTCAWRQGSEHVAETEITANKHGPTGLLERATLCACYEGLNHGGLIVTSESIYLAGVGTLQVLVTAEVGIIFCR
jgi:hypothetical protein